MGRKSEVFLLENLENYFVFYILFTFCFYLVFNVRINLTVYLIKSAFRSLAFGIRSQHLGRIHITKVSKFGCGHNYG